MCVSQYLDRSAKARPVIGGTASVESRLWSELIRLILSPPCSIPLFLSDLSTLSTWHIRLKTGRTRTEYCGPDTRTEPYISIDLPAIHFVPSYCINSITPPSHNNRGPLSSFSPLISGFCYTHIDPFFYTVSRSIGSRVFSFSLPKKFIDSASREEQKFLSNSRYPVNSFSSSLLYLFPAVKIVIQNMLLSQNKSIYKYIYHNRIA